MESEEIQRLVEGKVKDAIQANNGELLTNIGTMIKQISVVSATPNLVLDVPTFKRKSNEEQYKHHNKVLVKLEEAETSLKSSNVDAAKKSIIEAQSLVRHRQKLVQLADTSEQGWRTVAEYETNPIASDSDDERRIYKAEARALRKVKSERGKKRASRTPYSRPTARIKFDGVPASDRASTVSQQRQGVCFVCGKAGHWRMECPQRISHNKISGVFCCKEPLVEARNKTTPDETGGVRTGVTPGEGVGLNESLKRKFEEAGVQIEDGDTVVTHMASNLLASRADGTIAKYSFQVRAFKDFCISKGFGSAPAAPIHVAMYLSNMIDNGKSSSVIISAFYGIKWSHSINDLPDPTESSLVKGMLESAKRLNSKPVVKKDVLSSEMLIKLCDMYTTSNDVITLRDLTMIVLCYAGFLRYSEVSDLRCCDIDFEVEYFSLYIRKSKTDVYRSGSRVPISKGSTSACPYTMLSRYLSCAGLDRSSDKYLFRPACRSGSNCFLLDKDKKLSYTRARECMVQKLRFVAPNLSLGTHSLRASGASKAANSEGVSDRCLKRHGRWRSDSAKDGYIEDSIEKRLFITKQLGL